MSALLAYIALPEWSPYAVGVGIGLLSCAAFLLSDKPIGCSTAFARTSGMLEQLFRGKKVREMAYQRSFDYTDEGKLLGHITIGVEMVQEKLATIAGFPPELAMLLKHMLLSHHGQYEFGSPKRPKTLEATILNYLDDLDSKINGIRTHIAKETENPSRWSTYHRLYDRYFYKETQGGEVDTVPEIQPEPKVEQAPVKPLQDLERSRFQNSPFARLKDENLDLF